MTVDTRIYCTVEDCIHHTPEDECDCEKIHIADTFLAGAPARCDDYESED